MKTKGEQTTEVSYNNKLNEVTFTGFTDRDFNLFISIIARVSGKGANTQIKLDYATLKLLSGFENKHISNKEFNVMLRDMNRKLMSCICSLQDGSKEIDFVLFPEFIRDPEKGVLTVTVSDRLGYVVNDFNGYTSLELKRFVRIESKYTKTLYRKLRQFRSTGEYIVSAEQFKEEFLIPKSYKQSDIQKRVIIPSVEELKSEFKGLECIPHHAPKRGAPIDRYTFKFQASKQIPGQQTVQGYLDSINMNKTAKKKSKFNNIEVSPSTPKTKEEWDKFESKMLAN